MKRIKFICLTITVIGLLQAVCAFAHHGTAAGYDPNRRIALKGVITAVEWVNPHVLVYIDAPGESGKLERWALEGSAPNGLTHAGITKAMLLPGVGISVVGYPPKDGSNLSESLKYSQGALDSLKTSHVLQVGNMTFPDGQVYGYGMGPNAQSSKP